MGFKINQILSLRQGITQYGKAPHKPVLLLAVIDGFEKGYLSEKEVPISADLLTSFHDLWAILVDTPHVANFSLPFFHLGSEPSGFWQLKCLPGQTIPVTKSNSIKSYKALTETVECAVLSDDLFQALSATEKRKELKSKLLSFYFPITGAKIESKTINYSDSIREDIMYEPDVNYVRKVVKRLEQLNPFERETEMLIRSHQFKKAVLELYNQRCAITGMKIEVPGNIAMVDACHIIPFANSYDDTISNGIALSPTLHRAFDRGLVAISEDYRVLVHPQIKDYYPESGIRIYHGKMLHLPHDERFLPSPAKLTQHRQRFSF